MKKFLKVLALSLVLVPCAFVFAACGNNDYTMEAAQEDVQEFDAVSSALNEKAEADDSSSDTAAATLEISVAINGIQSTMDLVQTTVDAFNKLYENAKTVAEQTGVNLETYLKSVGLTMEKNGNSLKVSVKGEYEVNIVSSNNKIEVSYTNAKNSKQNSSIVIEKNNKGTEFHVNANIAGEAQQTIDIVKTSDGLALQTVTKVGDNYESTQVKVSYSYDKETNTATVTDYTIKTDVSVNAPSSIFGKELPKDFGVPAQD